MRPPADYFHWMDILKNLIYKAVLDVHSPGIGTGYVADESFIRGRVRPQSFLTRRPEIKKIIQAAADGVNKTPASVETIMNFTILPKKLYEEDGEVTPTMKVKRKHINQAFKDLIEAMRKTKRRGPRLRGSVGSRD
jgi:long-subunit acyl-CoA synthetase (AMP-forming)